MFIYLAVIILFPVIYIVNEYFQKSNFIPNYAGQKHQKFLGDKTIPLSGGIFLTALSMILFQYYNYIFCLFILLTFIIGFLSDINYLNSPKVRFLIQCIIIGIFVLILDIKIVSTKLNWLDFLLNNIFFKYLFSIFCLMILINGSNFIDGLNGLMIGYYIIVFGLVNYLRFHNYIGLDQNLIFIFLIFIFFLFLMNIRQKLFMGDSGSYVLGMMSGYFLIKFSELNQEISPYYIILLIWYPCFENLFSIIRKFTLKKSPIDADNNHLHQLIFFYLKKKINTKKMNFNNLSSFFILTYNLAILSIGSINSSHTQLQIILILINVIIYLIVYSKLFLFKYFIKSL
jgi:UDP-N-acetylmuramyl pentapeptide phosphotransferase/UDP-N-acetylglucosamine-1-phosphate transferase